MPCAQAPRLRWLRSTKAVHPVYLHVIAMDEICPKSNACESLSLTDRTVSPPWTKLAFSLGSVFDQALEVFSVLGFFVGFGVLAHVVVGDPTLQVGDFFGAAGLHALADR